MTWSPITRRILSWLPPVVSATALSSTPRRRFRFINVRCLRILITLSPTPFPTNLAALHLPCHSRPHSRPGLVRTPSRSPWVRRLIFVRPLLSLPRPYQLWSTRMSWPSTGQNFPLASRRDSGGMPLPSASRTVRAPSSPSALGPTRHSRDPTADKPSKVFIGFDLTRQIY